MGNDLRARIFISCGQRKGTDEERVANELAAKLYELGYDPYVASTQQSLEGLTEIIFRNLASSEYFLFIDFKREQFANSADSRGSLFSHQELAVAAYLNLPLMAFQESGVRKLDGIIGFLLANCEEFVDRSDLTDAIVRRVQEKGWRPDWKNQVVMEREANQAVLARHAIADKDAFYFHITVRNRNPYKQARNCYAFLQSIRDLPRGETIPVESVELKWAGYILPNATILPGAFRYLDGFFVFRDSPSVARFNTFADFEGYVPQLKGPGDYTLTYQVVSDDFAPAEAEIVLRLGKSLDEICFVQVGKNETAVELSQALTLSQESEKALLRSYPAAINPSLLSAQAAYTTASQQWEVQVLTFNSGVKPSGLGPIYSPIRPHDGSLEDKGPKDSS